jgi:16S rRNA (uracil1498-N3)-methyltransferase
MTHRFYVDAAQVQGDRVVFSSAQSHQLRHVLRLRQGEQVRVFDGQPGYDLLISLAEGDAGQVVGRCAQAPEPRTRLSVYPALLQRDKFELVLQKLTEVGVSAIGPVVTSRSLVREAPDDKRYARWQAILREAAEQSGRGVVPALLPTLGFAAALREAPGLRVVAYEGERRHSLRSALSSRPGCVSVFVGPEGGFSEDEIFSARDVGAAIVTLGPRVLRAETASTVLAALVLGELGDLSWPEDDDR